MIKGYAHMDAIIRKTGTELRLDEDYRNKASVCGK